MQQQQPIARQQIAQLRQHRSSQYKFQMRYLQQLAQQQLIYRNHGYDYYNGPRYYTAANYRYYRGGNYYEINNYGADVLRQAVNNGYEQGYYAGRADRQDRWHDSYEDSYAYQDANYGYSGYYVSQEDYNYYFRQGFQRGYNDGYRSVRQYGRFYNGRYSMLAPALATILILEALH